MDRRVVLSLVGALALFVAGPVAGYSYVFSHMADAVKDGTLLSVSVQGLMVAAVAWLVGLGILVQLAVCLHGKRAVTVLATDGSVACAGNLTGSVTITSTPQKTPISRLQWGDIECAAITDDDVEALAERYRDTTRYELVDALPGATLPDGRYVMDIAVEFMYPHGARAALNRSKELLTEA